MPPAAPPSKFVVTSALTVAGSIEDYDDEAMSLALRSRVATAAGVDVRAVTIELVSASVRLVFIIEAPSETTANAAALSLGSQIDTPQAASALMSTPEAGAVSVTAIDLTPLIEELPSPPPAPNLPPRSPPLPSSSVSPRPPPSPSAPPPGARPQTASSLIVTVSASVGAAVAVVALCLALTLVVRYRRRSEKVLPHGDPPSVAHTGVPAGQVADALTQPPRRTAEMAVRLRCEDGRVCLQLHLTRAPVADGVD